MLNMAKELDAKSCRVFLYLWGMSDDEGNVDTSLSQIHKETKLAVTTVRHGIAKLQESGLLSVIHDVGIKSYYKLLQPEETTQGVNS